MFINDFINSRTELANGKIKTTAKLCEFKATNKIELFLLNMKKEQKIGKSANNFSNC